MSVRKLLIVGWDAAEPSVVEPLVAKGELPNLAALRERGAHGTIASTVPPTSLPAWTTAMTGLDPGKHGVTDFVQREPGAYRLKLVSSADRRAELLPAIAGRAGLRVAHLGLPGSYPPEPLPGVCIAGTDTPAGKFAPVSAHYPPALASELKQAGLRWPYGGADELSVGPGWHSRARRALLEGLERRQEVTQALLAREPWDLFFVHFSEADTAGHHFWAFHDPQSPRHRDQPEVADTLLAVYRALDRALGRLLTQVEEQAAVIVVSDHGAGGSSDQVVYPNRWLADQGWLRFGGSRGPAARAAGLVRDAAIRLVPARAKEYLMRTPAARLALAADGLARFGGIDLPETRAFCDELPQNPGIWIHLRGRDPQGRVEPGEEYEALREQIAEQLLEWQDPQSGRKVVRKVRKREEAFQGPLAERAPDLLLELELWDGYKVLAAQSNGKPGPLIRRLSREEQIGAKGTGTSGVHRPDGIIAAAGPSVRTGGRIRMARLADLFPTALALLGLDLPEGLDGRVIPEIARKPKGVKAAGKSVAKAGKDVYSDAEETAIKKRLESLGYL